MVVKSATTVLSVGDYHATASVEEFVEQGDLVGGLVVRGVARGPVTMDEFDQRDVLAVAEVQVEAVVRGQVEVGDRIAVIVGTWTSNPDRPREGEHLRTNGWTFAPGDRVVASLTTAGIGDLLEWSQPDSFFVLDGDELSAELAATRSREFTRTTFLEEASHWSAADLRRELARAARGR